MQIDITYLKNPALGWDVTATATGEHQEQVQHIRATINSSPMCDENSDPPVNKWRRLFTQKGVYPGDNKVVVTVTDDRGNDSAAMEQWSS